MFSIKTVEFSLESRNAIVNGSVNYQTNLTHHDGEFDIKFNFDGQYWNICKFRLSGFGVLTISEKDNYYLPKA